MEQISVNERTAHTFYLPVSIINAMHDAKKRYRKSVSNIFRKAMGNPYIPENYEKYSYLFKNNKKQINVQVENDIVLQNREEAQKNNAVINEFYTVKVATYLNMEEKQ